MDEPEISPAPRNPESPAELPSADSGGPRLYRKIFTGPQELRAGWRLLIFLALLTALFSAAAEISRLLMHHRAQRMATLAPGTVLAAEAFMFAVVLAASAIMGKFERRSLGSYGLPLRRAFCATFWQGAAIGFAGISALLGAMGAAGVFHADSIALHGPAIGKYAVLWGLVFMAVALFEEFSFRGYALFTLTTGVGFWPAAAVSSFLFGYVHHGNRGETWLGAFNAGLVGLLFCLMVRRSGDLWLAVGFHAAWDWGESYFYGVPDSGQLVAGHLMNVSFTGPSWLTGGTVGPEGSWLCTALLVVLWLMFLAWMREAKYPNRASAGPEVANPANF